MLGILLAATVAAAPPPTQSHSQWLAALAARAQLRCPNVRQQKTAADDKPGPKKLGDLPDAELYHAVLKEAGGCPIDEVYQNGHWVDLWTGPPGRDLRNARRLGR